MYVCVCMYIYIYIYIMSCSSGCAIHTHAPCPRQFVEQMCITKYYSWKFVYKVAWGRGMGTV